MALLDDRIDVALPAGTITFSVRNAGTKITEFYLYGTGDRIMGEVENIGPGLSRDLVASVPERHTGNLRAGMHSFALPVPLPEVTVSLLWHPRLDADPAHERASNRLTIDARSGAVKSHERYADKPAGAKLMSSIFVLHSGSFTRSRFLRIASAITPVDVRGSPAGRATLAVGRTRRARTRPSHDFVFRVGCNRWTRRAIAVKPSAPWNTA